MVPNPVSYMNQGALYWCFHLMYYLFRNSFGKVKKTLKVEQGVQYIWRTLQMNELFHCGLENQEKMRQIILFLGTTLQHW